MLSCMVVGCLTNHPLASSLTKEGGRVQLHGVGSHRTNFLPLLNQGGGRGVVETQTSNNNWSNSTSHGLIQPTKPALSKRR